MEKVFADFGALPHFSRKLILNSSSKFGILKPWTNPPWPRRFQLGFWQILLQIDRKLQYLEKTFVEFQGLFRFPRKIVLYLSTNFGIRKTWTNFPLPRTFDLSFWQTSKQIYVKLQCRGKAFEEFQGLPWFLRKIILYSVTKFGILKP